MKETGSGSSLPVFFVVGAGASIRVEYSGMCCSLGRMKRRVALIGVLILLAAPGQADSLRRVIAGDRIIVNGTEIRLRDTYCPPVSTKEGQEAKRIMQIMLFARKLECRTREVEGETVGDCTYGRAAHSHVGRSMVEELKRRNLCQRFGRT